MNDLDTLGNLLNCKQLSNDWNFSYGLTESRKKALVNSDNSDSIFNPLSETALTLFMLGNIDQWKQNGTLKEPLPRVPKNSNWSKKFFKNIRKNEKVFKKDHRKDNLWTELFNKKIKCDIVDFQKSILLFEFRIMNAAFNSNENKAFKNLSFVNIDNKPNWGQFDAVLMIPNQKLFILFESKLTSDISRTTSEYRYINQIMRNLESAFLLTHHKESNYKEWDFKYAFICPKKDFNYKSTYYSCVLGSISEHISLFEKSLLNEFNLVFNKTTYEMYFNQFKNKIIEDTDNCIIQVYWDKIGEILKNKDPDFFNNYFNRLSMTNSIKEESIENIRKRFSIAEIKL